MSQVHAHAHAHDHTHELPANLVPSHRDVARLRPENALGLRHLGFALAATAISIPLSISGDPLLWLVGQLSFALGFTCWFALLHEAGHKTLFRSAALNRWSGHLAGFMSGIPFCNWRMVHMRHHLWTGWQDLDPTTATILPRPLSWIERTVINLCWTFWIPLFSVVYRLQNYWWLPRLWPQFERRDQRLRLLRNTVFALALYGALFALIGPMRSLQCFGLGLWLGLAFQDVLLLSQHSHIPMDHSGGVDVDAYPPVEQEQFTRSLVFPNWFSRYVLLNMDAHELHHMFPSVPGYHLHQIDYRPANTMSWWQWISRAKHVPGTVLIFQCRTETGWDL